MDLIDEQITKLDKQLAQVEGQLRAATVANDRRVGLLALRKKQDILKRLESCNNQRIILGQNEAGIQQMIITSQVMSTIKDSTQALRSLAPEGQIDAFSDIMADFQDTMQGAEELNMMFADAAGTYVDSADVDAEWNALVEQQTAAELPTVPSGMTASPVGAVSAPAAPMALPAVAQDPTPAQPDEEDALAALMGEFPPM
jgi:hypothetical protein